MHILTAGHYTYISDNRYEAIYEEHTDTWVLLIRSVQLRDSGLFECQLSSLPVISYFVHLTVLEPSVEILGDDDLYVQSGSSLNLTCVIENLPSDSDVIRWIHEDRVLSYKSVMGGSGVSIWTSKGDLSTSSLIIHRLGTTDGGTYACVPGDLQAATINVHVLKGKKYTLNGQLYRFLIKFLVKFYFFAEIHYLKMQKH